MLTFYITCASAKEAKDISKALIERKLAACTNIVPCTSFFRSDNKIKEESEFIIFAKTSDNRKEAVIKAVKKIHSYSVPCICFWHSSANEDYEKWVDKETK